MIHRRGSLRGEKILYPDGVGCCIWYPFDAEEDENMGIAFDFPGEDIDDLIALLQQLNDAEAEIYEEADDER